MEAGVDTLVSPGTERRVTAAQQKAANRNKRAANISRRQREVAVSSFRVNRR
jgi:hypothetical protein